MRAFIHSRRVEIWQSAIALGLVPMAWVQGSLWRREFTWVLHASFVVAVAAFLVGWFLQRRWKEETRHASVRYLALFVANIVTVGVGSWAFIALGPLNAVAGTLVAALALTLCVVVWTMVGPRVARAIE